MDLFIPHICIAPLSEVSNDKKSHINYTDIKVPEKSEFQKVYFEELARKCYEEEGSFKSISDIARIHYEEFYGAGSGGIKRWQVFFTKYNILINVEEKQGNLQIKAA